MATNIRALLNSEELARVTRKNDLRAAGIVLSDWSMVIGLFALAAAFPNPVTILFTVLLLGGRQMAFGVLVHETGHQSFFTSRRANDFVATWLSGYWVFSDKDAYMKGHPQTNPPDPKKSMENDLIFDLTDYHPKPMEF